ncbi:MAG: iron ABC transporter permease [Lachnospiraceae bacterium]|nr:iron ABC transporter permease [Lachnospiraceae bacterium]
MAARSRQGKELENKKLTSDSVLMIAIVGISVLLILFVIYPMVMLIGESFEVAEGQSLFQNYINVLNMSTFKKALKNTIIIGLVSSTLSTIIGFLFGYVDAYLNVKSRLYKAMFSVVSTLPVVSPPFVLSLSALMLFGNAGLITRHIFGILDSNIKGYPGIILVQTMTYFPVCYLMIKGLLRNIDPSLEEATRNMGATRWQVFKTVTLPLMLPGLGNAFLVTFLESCSDFANPIMIGGNVDTLATAIYLQYTGGFSTGSAGNAAAMAVFLLSLTLVFFLVQKYVFEARSVATLTGKASRARIKIEDRHIRMPLMTITAFIGAFVIGMYLCVLYGSVETVWGYNYKPTLKWWAFLFKRGGEGLKAFGNSFELALIAAVITSFFSMLIAYLVARRRFPGRHAIEFVSMIAMAFPGTVLGVAYIRGFVTGVFHTGFLQGLYGSAAILVIVFVIRSLPVGVRSGIAALNQIDKSIEESAYDMGADSAKVFTTVTLPLIKDSFFSGLVTAFVRSITSISAVILLVNPRILFITVRINAYADNGNFGVACVYATLLVVLAYLTITIMNLIVNRLSVDVRREYD